MSIRRSRTTLMQHRGRLKAPVVGVKRPYISLRAAALTPIESPDDGDASAYLTTPEPSEYSPVVDMEVPNVITLAVSRQMPSDALFSQAKLAPLPPVTDPSFEELLGGKLHLCSQLMDFSATDETARLRDEKSDTLLELDSLLENRREALKLNGMLRRAIFRMIATNVLREDPVFPTAQKTGDYTINVLEPSWAHLFLCHQMLTRFVVLFPDAEYVNFSVVQRALFLTQVPDANERVHFVNFLKAYYDTHPGERVRFLKAVRDKLVLLREGGLVPFCAMPLLLCVTHILSRGICDMLKVFKDMVTQALLPLLAHRYLPVYYQNYKTTLVMVARELPELKLVILQAIQDLWPVCSGTKSAFTADLLVYMASTIPGPVFALMSGQFFLFCAKQCYSDNFKLVSAILSMFTRDYIVRFIRENAVAAIDRLYEPLQHVAKNHWCLAVRERALQALERMEKVDKTDYAKKANAVRSREETLKKQAAGLLPIHRINEDNRPLRKWTQIIKLAALNDKEFDSSAKMAEITALFVIQHNIALRDISRIIPSKRQKKAEELMAAHAHEPLSSLRTARENALGSRKSGTAISLRPLVGALYGGP